MKLDSVFSKGADLWVLPHIEDSDWRWLFEWSLNFQISRSLGHERAHLSTEAMTALDLWEATEFSDIEPSDSPWTLIGCEKLLPTKWVLVSRSLTPAQFEKELDKAWAGLGKPSTRIFPSKEWTKQRLKELKSNCLKSAHTEIAPDKETSIGS
ncbi:MAG: hypothetical protein GW917_01565 [Bdellovibrionales bacterium]|nr:hypothetical protein [Bdellovibrionales bacterium]